MIYSVFVQINQLIEVEAENAEGAVLAAKSKLDPRIAAAAHFEVAQEPIFDQESNTYKLI